MKPAERSSLTECCVGLVFCSSDMRGTRHTWVSESRHQRCGPTGFGARVDALAVSELKISVGRLCRAWSLVPGVQKSSAEGRGPQILARLGA